MEDYRSNFVGEDASDCDFAKYLRPESRVPCLVPTTADTALSNLLRNCLRTGSGSEFNEEQIERCYRESSLPQRYSRLFFVLYSPGHKRVLITRSYTKEKWSFSRLFMRLCAHSRRQALTENDFSLQIDFVEEPPSSVNLFRVGMTLLGERHFEIGLDGILIYGQDGRRHFFLPGDAYVRSIMGMRQLRSYLSDSYGESYLRRAACQRFNSSSFLIRESGPIRLYRGLPVVGELNKFKMEHAVNLAVEHIKHTQEGSGKFLYYYDSSSDSRKDHEHPGRDSKKNPYYNILRHSGGALTCIYYEKYTREKDAEENIRRAIDYLKTKSRFYSIDDIDAAYIYSEKKSKLGGAGIALYLLAEYQQLTGDELYQSFADALAWHVLHQITETGEFIYYNIYLDRELNAEENSKYFSFYYPGEALCGLGKYLHLLPRDRRDIYFDKIKLALEYLIFVRPVERESEYTEVPSDSWLMMAVMELWDFEELRNPLYAEFVFSDARKMIDQMYKVSDAPYPDYAGAFYYQFGDYPYADGARLEGLLGAYELACKMNEVDIKRLLWKALKLGAWSVMHLVNTPDAIYSAKRPDIALGGIRFKYTRQWFRIDTIQHVACFYAKLIPHWDSAESL